MDKKTLAIILLPILTWFIVLTCQQWRRYRILKAQEQEFFAAKRQLEELGRNVRGIKVNNPFPLSLPFRHIYLGAAPPIRKKPVLIWVAYHIGFQFRKEVCEQWQKLLNKYPSLFLTVAIMGLTADEVRAFGPPEVSLEEIKLRMNHPRITFIYSSGTPVYYSFGPPGTVIFIDDKGIVRHVESVEFFDPSEGAEKLSKIVGAYLGGVSQ